MTIAVFAANVVAQSRHNILVGQRLDFLKADKTRQLTSPDDDIDAALEDDVMFSMKLKRLESEPSPIAYITFPIASGRRRIRVPAGHKVVLKFRGTVVIERLELNDSEGRAGSIAPLAPVQVQNANFNWLGPSHVPTSVISQASL